MTDTRGLSIVDDTLNEVVHTKEDQVHEEDDDEGFVVKIEDEIDACTEHDDIFGDRANMESSLDTDEEKINLFDVVEEKGPEKEIKDSVQSSTLIITTEEHLEATIGDDTLDETAQRKPLTNENFIADSSLPESKKAVIKPKPKGADQSYIWVSNINRNVKATDLKKFFSQIGKVVTAKILTNGKSYFGYLSVDSAETAHKCIKKMNNTFFDGKKIVVSKDRPDLRETKSAAVKIEPRRKRNEPLEFSKESKGADVKIPIEKQEIKNNRVSTEDEGKTSDVIVELKKKMEKLKSEISRYKMKILEYQRRHEGMRKKCSELEKELKESQFKLRADRRRLNQDREQFEKTKKLDLVRLEADKNAVNKELSEVKKLREDLKAKIDNFKAQNKKNLKVHSVRSSPLPERSRSPRGRSPLMRLNVRGGGYRPEERNEKKRKRHDPVRGRSPPPPPKLGNMGKKLLSHRQYYEEAEKRSPPLDSHSYEFRHKPSFGPPQEVSRPPWPPVYPKDPRRVNAAPTASYPADQRFGGGYQFPPSSITVPQRSYYPDFGKPYGHY